MLSLDNPLGFKKESNKTTIIINCDNWWKNYWWKIQCGINKEATIISALLSGKIWTTDKWRIIAI